MFKSGFVNIIGRPNVGKSTLMNALVGVDMSIITYKPQTTRHRIHGILNGPDFQIVFSDTPGFVHDPAYKMHQKMNRFVFSTFEDADIMILVTDHEDSYDADHPLVQRIRDLSIPKILVINKIDISGPEKVQEMLADWNEKCDFDTSLAISALARKGTQSLLETIMRHLPEGPKYYPDDQLSDRPERFFVSEMIREQLFLLYREEIPYSCEVAIESFKEGEDITRISALIFTNRKTQKSIIIGKEGKAIKKLGTQARAKIERFLGQKVYLELRVKVRENWRNNEGLLDKLGYR